MSMKDITDKQVLQAYLDAEEMRERGSMVWPDDLLAQRTGQAEKVCLRCLERAEDRGLIESGVTTRSGWLTEKGKALIDS